MEPMTSRKKQLVEVIALHQIDGHIAHLSIALKDGRKYNVETFENPIGMRDKPTMHRYPVKIKGKSTYLYEENGVWWVLMKN